MLSVKHGIGQFFLTDKKAKDKLRQAIEKPNNDYAIRKLTDIIRPIIQGNGTVEVRTPFTKPESPGVKIRHGQGNILFGDMDENDQKIYDAHIIAGPIGAYNALAERITGHYKASDLERIYNYLSIPYDAISDLDSFNTYVANQWKEIPKHLQGNASSNEEKARKALNYFSAILMFAEPYRIPDGGRQSRGLIRKIYQLFPSKDSLIQSPMKSSLSSELKPDERSIPQFLMTTKGGRRKVEAAVFTEGDDDPWLEAYNDCISDDETQPGPGD